MTRARRQITLSAPDIGPLERELVLEVLGSKRLALGPVAEEFEQLVARRTGRRHGIAVSSGTAGLHILVHAFGIGAGHEVVTTPFSFIASSNAILFENARPKFVDVEERTGNLDPAGIEAALTPRTRAILAVDVFGHPARLEEIAAIGREHQLTLIEDACEAIGAELNGVPVGNGRFADAAVFAFYPNKQVTTGEGGLIVTDDGDLADLCRSLRNQGRATTPSRGPQATPSDGGDAWLDHVRLGFNYRMDELSAALGVAQTRRLDELLERRAAVADGYRARLDGVEHVRLPTVDPAVSRMSWFVFVVQVGWNHPAGEQAGLRGRVMRRLEDAGVPCRPYFQPIHLQPFYRERFGFVGGEFPVAERLGRTSIALPFHGLLDGDDMDYVADALRRAVGREA